MIEIVKTKNYESLYLGGGIEYLPLLRITRYVLKAMSKEEDCPSLIRNILAIFLASLKTPLKPKIVSVKFVGLDICR